MEKDAAVMCVADGCEKQPSCRGYCNAHYLRVWRLDNLERERERSRAYYDTHKEEAKRRRKAWLAANADKMRESQEQWRRKNPEKVQAHDAVSNALKQGKLVKQPCEACGADAQAHHDDYSKPLEVRWLCPTHHAEHHRVERRAAA